MRVHQPDATRLHDAAEFQKREVVDPGTRRIRQADDIIPGVSELLADGADHLDAADGHLEPLRVDRGDEVTDHRLCTAEAETGCQHQHVCALAHPSHSCVMRNRFIARS